MSYRRGSNTQTNNQMIIMPENPEKQRNWLGKKLFSKPKPMTLLEKSLHCMEETGLSGLCLRKDCQGKASQNKSLLNKTFLIHNILSALS